MCGYKIILYIPSFRMLVAGEVVQGSTVYGPKDGIHTWGRHYLIDGYRL